MIPKPRIGEACNACGLCCQIQVCMNGAYAMGLVRQLGDTIPGPCPAIQHKPDGRMTCGIVENPAKYLPRSKYPAKVLSKHFANLIGAGTGCDELGYEEDPEEEAKLDQIIQKIRNDPEWIKKAQLSIKVIHGI